MHIRQYCKLSIDDIETCQSEGGTARREMARLLEPLVLPDGYLELRELLDV